MPFEPGRSGNPAGAPVGSRHRQQLNGEFIAALLRDFRQGGPKAIERVRRTQPAAYLKILALLMPREHKVEHSNPLKAMTDEQLDEALAALRQWVAEREGDDAKLIEGAAEPTALLEREAEAANVIEGSAKPVALPAPEAQSPEATPEPKQKHKSNHLPVYCTASTSLI